MIKDCFFFFYDVCMGKDFFSKDDGDSDRGSVPEITYVFYDRAEVVSEELASFWIGKPLVGMEDKVESGDPG